VVLCGSHGGLSSAIFALKKGVRGVIFNDAGGGKDQAGIAGLALLEENGIYAATVDADSAKIGIGMETYETGIISHLNRLALEMGLAPGIRARDAAWRILREKEKNHRPSEPDREAD